MEEVPDDVLIVILTDVVYKRHYIKLKNSEDNDTIISYYSVRLINKRFCDLITRKAPIYALPVRILLKGGNIYNCTVFHNVKFIVCVAYSRFTDDDFKLAISLNPNTIGILSLNNIKLPHGIVPLTYWDVLRIVSVIDDFRMMELLFLLIDVDPQIGYSICQNVMFSNYNPNILRCLLSHPDIDPTRDLARLIRSKDSSKTAKVLFEERIIDRSRLHPLDNRSVQNIIDSKDIIDYMVIIAETGNIELVEALYQTHIDLSLDNDKMLRTACKYGNIEIVKLLLTDPDVDPKSHGWFGSNSFEITSLYQRTEILKLLNEPRVFIRTRRREYLAGSKK